MEPAYAAYRYIYCVSNPSEMEFMSHTPLPSQRANRAGFSRFAKRTLEYYGIGGLALLLALPLIAIFATIVYFTDRGPPFYFQPRSEPRTASA